MPQEDRLRFCAKRTLDGTRAERDQSCCPESCRSHFGILCHSPVIACRRRDGPMRRGRAVPKAAVAHIPNCHAGRIENQLAHETRKVLTCQITERELHHREATAGVAPDRAWGTLTANGWRCSRAALVENLYDCRNRGCGCVRGAMDGESALWLSNRRGSFFAGGEVVSGTSNSQHGVDVGIER